MVALNNLDSLSNNLMVDMPRFNHTQHIEKYTRKHPNRPYKQGTLSAAMVIS